ncbi:MAG: hypothetical protein ACOC44_00825 [Promethearchaeia archaeon]
MRKIRIFAAHFPYLRAKKSKKMVPPPRLERGASRFRLTYYHRLSL